MAEVPIGSQQNVTIACDHLHKHVFLVETILLISVRVHGGRRRRERPPGQHETDDEGDGAVGPGDLHAPFFKHGCQAR